MCKDVRAEGIGLEEEMSVNNERKVVHAFNLLVLENACILVLVYILNILLH